MVWGLLLFVEELTSHLYSYQLSCFPVEAQSLSVNLSFLELSQML